MTLVDTNILLDLLTNDPAWAPWSEMQLEAAVLRGPLVIDPVVYAELSVRFTAIEDLDAFLTGTGLMLVPTPRAALFVAAKAFRRYRVAGGVRTGVLPDFFIGAHAAATGAALITRDARRYASYFPSVELITPERRPLN